MSTPALIEIIGVNGERFCVSGPGMGAEGVELATTPEGLHDEAPFKSIWQQSAFQEGATFLGVATEPLDLVLGFNVMPNVDRWEDVESRFHACFDVETPATIRFTPPGEETRTLKVVKLERIKTTSKIDPRIFNYSNMVVTLRAPWPFWEGETITRELVFNSSGSQEFTLENKTDRPAWLQWAATAPGQWTIPDYDLSSDSSGDRYRRIVTPNLGPGQALTIDTNPLNESYVAADGSNVSGLFNGVQFLYPVPPHTPPTKFQVTFKGASGAIQARLVENWKRGWGGRKS